MPAATRLPASLVVLTDQAQVMLESLDRARAETFVQQITNKHGDDDVFRLLPGGITQTYAERMTQLDEHEQNLRDGLPKAVLDQLDKETAS